MRPAARTVPIILTTSSQSMPSFEALSMASTRGLMATCHASPVPTRSITTTMKTTTIFVGVAPNTFPPFLGVARDRIPCRDFITAHRSSIGHLTVSAPGVRCSQKSVPPSTCHRPEGEAPPRRTGQREIFSIAILSGCPKVAPGFSFAVTRALMGRGSGHLSHDSCTPFTWFLYRDELLILPTRPTFVALLPVGVGSGHEFWRHC